MDIKTPTILTLPYVLLIAPSLIRIKNPPISLIILDLFLVSVVYILCNKSEIYEAMKNFNKLAQQRNNMRRVAKVLIVLCCIGIICTLIRYVIHTQ
jgi:hypothetical protein